MKLSKKIITLFAAVLAFAMVVSGAFAASGTSVEAGKSATVTFTFADIYNVDGEFTVSDPQKIISTYSINVADAGTTAAVVNGNRLWASPSAEPVKTTVSVTVTLSVKASAAVGSSCTVSFTGIYGDANEEPGNEHDITQTATVSVKAAPSTPSETPTPTPSATPTPTPSATPAPTPSVTPAPSPSAAPTPTTTVAPSDNPTPSSPSVDYSELQKQINIASGLIASDYTDESRDLLAAALSAAQNAMNSQDQGTVTAAAEVLRTTVAGLVRMDYSKLKEALSQSNALLGTEQGAVLWQQLSEAAEKSKQLLQSGDQQAVDQAANELTDILGQIAALLEVETETKVVVQEVPVEVLPEGDYCNIPTHHVWSVLFWVSAALNLALIGVIVAYVIRRTKNRRDDTPLVDYDIDDDF